MRPYPEINQPLKVLYHRTTCETARNLARTLGIGYTKSPKEDEVVAIRWGSSRGHCNDVALNPPGAVELAADGKESLSVLAEAGIPCVQILENPPEDGYPIIARGRINHIAGNDIQVIETKEEAIESGAKYFTRYRQADKELRIHVFGDEVLRVFRKVPRETNADMVVKTSDRGWGYHITNHEKYYHLAQSIAINAVKCLGLNSGGVDMGWNEADRKYFIFEVNSGPALNSITLQHYADKFRAHLERNCEYEPVNFSIEVG